jgi:PA14 domain-containing protein/purple acid phosphatase-like protein/Ig-like domain-containing protein
MPFSKSVSFSRLNSLLFRKAPAKWIRLVSLVLLFAVVLSSVPVHLKHDSAKAESRHPQRTQGEASRNLLDLGETSGNAASSGLRKEHGLNGLEPIAMQGAFVTVSPTAYQTGGFTNISNTGGSTSAFASAEDIQLDPSQNITDGKSATWSSFQGGPSVGIIGLKLKFDWTASGGVDAFVNASGSASARIFFDVDYSIDGGLSWTNAATRSRIVSQSGQGSKTDSINSEGGSVEIVLSPSQNISLVQVRDSTSANARANAPNVLHAYAESSASISTGVSSIRLEFEMDTIPPSISSVAAGGITPNSATITWNTNEPGDSQVDYGPTGYTQSTALNTALVTSHSQGLSGLNPRTLYHYRVKSKDASGNLATSSDSSFTTPTDNAAAFVSQSVPATMTAGETYAVTVSMLNQGITTWTPGQAYRLGSQNPQDNTIWMTTNRVLLPGNSISPGATATFSFVVTAPSSPGSYNFQWQMVQDGLEWFGAKTPNIAVQVVPRNDNATFISQTVPSVMLAGGAYSVSITFQNTGNTTWTAANQYRLGSQNPTNNGTWGPGRVYLEASELVAPGAFKTFSFQVVAPSTPGSYNFQWQMLRELVNWFGAASTNITLGVTTSSCLANVPTNHWKGEYFNKTDLSVGPMLVRDDGPSFLNINFGEGSPSTACGIDVDNFSARWTREVIFAATTYRFSVTGDDGVKLWVNGQLMIDKWFPQGATTYTAEVTFNTAGPRPVILEYFESGGPGLALLSWEDVTGVNCLPNAPLPLISSVPQTDGRENIASTAPSQAPKRCGQKNSD